MYTYIRGIVGMFSGILIHLSNVMLASVFAKKEEDNEEDEGESEEDEEEENIVEETTESNPVQLVSYSQHELLPFNSLFRLPIKDTLITWYCNALLLFSNFNDCLEWQMTWKEKEQAENCLYSRKTEGMHVLLFCFSFFYLESGFLTVTLISSLPQKYAIYNS